MKTIYLGALLGLTLVLGCTTVRSVVGGTPYQAYSSITGGYSETFLAPDIVRIVFRGNSSTSIERAKDLALLRAADLSSQAGFKYFTILREESESRQVGAEPAIFAPKSEIQVQFLNEKSTGIVAFDDQFLSKTLKQKYEVQ